MSTYSSDSEDGTTPAKLFGRQRPIYDVLGGGQVANILLWRDKRVSAALTIGTIVIWLLFEVVGYNFVTLFCHICITCMLVIFIWCRGAEFFDWNTPELPRSIWDKSNFQYVVSTFHSTFNEVLSNLLDIASGKDPALFILAISCLYGFSIIGNYLSFLNFVTFSSLCLQILPFLYEKYEGEVDYYAHRLIRNTKKLYGKFDSTILNKIPRGPVKVKKAS